MRVSSNSTMTSEQCKAFGAEAKNLRKRAGLTAADFADCLGVTKTHIYNIEAGSKKPSPQLVAKIADAFNTTVEAMLNPNDDRAEDFRKKYGRALKEHREAKGLSCSVIAGALGIPLSVYKEFEQGLCSITERHMETLDKLLGIGEKPKVVEKEVVVEVPAEVPASICDTILSHIKDLQIDVDAQKEVWHYFREIKLATEERELFG